MKNIAHPSFLLIELLLRCRLTVGENVFNTSVLCSYSQFNTIARCHNYTSPPPNPNELADLILKDDPKFYNVVQTLSLVASNVQHHSWLISEENMFTRYTNLINIAIEGQLKVDVDKLSAIQSQLFNFPTLSNLNFGQTRINYTTAVSRSGFTLPQNLSTLMFINASPDLINWKKPSLLHYLLITGTDQASRLPQFSYPSLEWLGIDAAPSIRFTTPEIGFLCVMKQFTFNFDMLLQNPCECKLMQTWQEYLKNEGSPLTITITGMNITKPFNESDCNPKNITCPSQEGILQDARDRRTSCQNILSPPTIPTTFSTPPSTLNPNETTPPSTLSPTITIPSPNPSVAPANGNLLINIVIGVVFVVVLFVLLVIIACMVRNVGESRGENEEEDEEEEE